MKTINVSTIYMGDDNNDNSILIEWGLDGVDFSLGNHTSPTHPASPYIYSITGLDNNQVYQVQITYQDGDGTVHPNGPVAGGSLMPVLVMVSSTATPVTIKHRTILSAFVATGRLRRFQFRRRFMEIPLISVTTRMVLPSTPWMTQLTTPPPIESAKLVIL